MKFNTVDKEMLPLINFFKTTIEHINNDLHLTFN
ncbi:MAG: hypothetical protein JWR61_967 [Ferruginibacter sp.]|jgi:hypothetical protein|nr:hypothetical protein [Ferruginibacter sp.]